MLTRIYRKVIQIKLYNFWVQGYLYLSFALLLFLLFAFSGRVGIYDWQKEIAYFQYIKHSLTSFHTLPWVWWDRLDNIEWYPAVSYSHCFICNPETMLFSPFTFLLIFMNVLPYIKLLVLIHCIIGIAGSFVLKNSLNWNLSQFRVFSIIFLLSPIIIQHLSVGYTPWLNLFYFPWLVHFISNKKNVLNILGTSSLLALVLLQGGTHVFFWFFLFTLFYLLIDIVSRRDWQVLFNLLSILCVTLLLSAPRLYASLTYADFHQPFQTGYGPFNFLFWALFPPFLLPPIDYLFAKMVFMGVPSWDGGIFWGIAFFMALILVIRYRHWLVSSKLENNQTAIIYRSIFITSTALFVLSFFSIFEYCVNLLNIIYNFPFLNGVEKYPFRLAIPSFLGFAVIIAGQFEYICREFEKLVRSCCKVVLFIKLKSILRIVVASGFAGFLIALVVRLLFSENISKILHDLTIKAYHGESPEWISWYMIGRSINPIEYYLEKMDRIFSQSDIFISLGLAFFTVLLFLPRRIQKNSNTIYECLLLIPFLFASTVWLVLSISVPNSKFGTQMISPPKFQVNVSDLDNRLYVSPRSIYLLPINASHDSLYTFKDISVKEGKSLRVATKNALLANSNGKLTIVPLDGKPIHVEFKDNAIKSSIIASIVAWMITSVVLAFILNILLRVKKVKRVFVSKRRC